MNILITLALINFTPMNELHVADKNKSDHEIIFDKGRKNKSGRYKKKKGLFRKKNGCDCPKH